MATNAAAGAGATVTPVFPLILLETMRDMDRPEEYLEGENPSASMPRRLGLSDVVFRQIHHFQEEVKRKRMQRPDTVADLIRLVIRRPDGDEIFEEAGRRVARHAWRERSGPFRKMVRFLPAGAKQRSARKAAQKLFRQLAGEAQMAVTVKPVALSIAGSITSHADPGGAACAFYSGALSELVTEYTGRKTSASHPRCEARGGKSCEWVTQVVS
jgi:predicted hydrocarbon binding protein